MKKVSLILSTVVMIAMMLSSCGEGASNEVTIGKQVWMVENLNVDKFRNGDPIPHAETDGEWEKAGENKQPAWCYYDNDPANGAKYGKLYNWYAVNDPRGLAPEGWHIPTDTEWTDLENYLGDCDGTKMKSTSGWAEYGSGTNESGFSGLPGGCREDYGEYFDIGKNGTWWGSADDNKVGDVARDLSYDDCYLYQIFPERGAGFSVRCIRD